MERTTMETNGMPKYATPEQLNEDLEATGERVIELSTRIRRARANLKDDGIPLLCELLGRIGRELHDAEGDDDQWRHRILVGMVARVEGVVRDALDQLDAADVEP